MFSELVRSLRRPRAKSPDHIPDYRYRVVFKRHLVPSALAVPLIISTDTPFFFPHRAHFSRGTVDDTLNFSHIAHGFLAKVWKM